MNQQVDNSPVHLGQAPAGAAPVVYPPTDPAGTSAVWGAHNPPGTSGRMRWTRKNTAIAIGVAVVVAGGGGAAVYAAGSSSAGTAGQVAGGQGIPGSGAGGGAGAAGDVGALMGGAAGGLSTALHGEYVVSEGGSYVTMLTQTGEITAVGPTSVTVKSADGVSLSYSLGTETTVSSRADTTQAGQGGPPGATTATQGALSDLSIGKTVRVTAKKGAPENTAEAVVVSTAAAGN